MFKPGNSRIIFVTLAAVLTLAACDKSADEEAGDSLASGHALLRYVPADSPYVVANVEPLPDDLLDKLEPKLDEVLASYDELVGELFKVFLAEAGTDIDEAEMQRFTAVVDELSTLMSLEGMRSAGFDRDSTGVIYGNGLLPVIRIKVSDVAMFDAALSRIEQSAGEKFPTTTIGNHSIRFFDTGEIKILIAGINDHVVFTVAPSDYDESQISRLLGLTVPDRNIMDAGILQGIADEYGFSSHYVGYVDFEAIVGMLFGADSGPDTDFLSLSSKDRPELSEVCKAEIMSLAGIAPRMVIGYTEIDARQMKSQAVIEIREDIAAGLATLPAAVPGLGGDEGGLMSFGMSLDVMAARNFYEARLNALEAEPFECEKFAGFQAGISSGREALNQRVPPIVYDFRGFLTVINDIEGLNLATETPPTSIDGRMLLAMENATALLAMGAMFSPELAGLSILPDGVPVKFESAQLQSVVDAVYVAMTESAIAVSFGEGVEQELGDMIAADVANDGTFMSVSMDAGRYYRFIGEAIMLAEQEEENPMSPEMQMALNNMMVAVSNFYDRMSADFRLTERGVEIDSTITIQD